MAPTPAASRPASYSHSCALTTNGTATCWSWDNAGQTAAPSGRFTAIAAGAAHSCALDPDGAVVCWGDDFYGQSSVPETSFVTLRLGLNHSCAITAASELSCWGLRLGERHHQCSRRELPGRRFGGRTHLRARHRRRVELLGQGHLRPGGRALISATQPWRPKTSDRLLAGISTSSVKPKPRAAASASTASRSRTPNAGSRALSHPSNCALLGAVCCPPRL